MMCFNSCKDIIETDLTKETISVNAPVDNLSSNNLTQTFWWDEEPGATFYNLQIVSPTFSGTVDILLDTNVTINKFTYVLTSGSFQWRVRAENSSSATNYVTRSLTISNSSDLSSQTISLSFPADKLNANYFVVTFDWLSIPIADGYRLQVASPDFSASFTQHLDTFIIADQYNYTFPVEGNFSWRVMAEDTMPLSTSPYSTRSITIDTTSPGMPVNSLPLASDSVSIPFSFTWERGVETGSGINVDSLFIYSDSLLNSLENSYQVTDTFYTNSSPLISGDYWWFVKSTDGAGNESLDSDISGFIVK